MIHYPYYSKKTIGSIASEALHNIWREEDITFTGTTLGLEILYHRHQIKIDAPTEMRVAFGYSDLRPRCYFAMGPTQYYPARHIQSVFNVILDSIPSVSRETRFDISGIRMTDEEVLFIYDYASFTSSLVELSAFTDEIAGFYADTVIQIFDTAVGIVEVNLGEMIAEYNTICNKYPTFVLKRDLDPDSFEDVFITHHTGMLGVPGNISSSTLLHGIHLMILVLSMYARCVGDDAIGCGYDLDEQRKRPLQRCLENIGNVSLEKMEFWESQPLEEEKIDEYAWNYTKRKLVRSGERALLDSVYIVFPSLGDLRPSWADSVHTKKSQDVKPIDCARRLVVFARQFHNIDLLDVERRFIDHWLDVVLIATGIKEIRPDLGGFKYMTGFVYPRNVEECRIEGLLSRYSCSSEILSIPDLQAIPEEPMRPGAFVSKSSRALKFIVDFGYGTKTLKRKRVIARDAIEDLRLLMFGSYSLLYDVEVFASCPDFMYDLIPETHFDDYYDTSILDEEW
jgi:hypothetical protein